MASTAPMPTAAGSDALATDDLTIDELIALAPVATEHDLPYLPIPNRVDAVLSDRVAPSDINPTAFVFPLLPDGSMMMAHNTRRGLEIPGGHREGDETAEHAAARETKEEAGCIMDSIRPIGIFRSTTEGARPDGYRYPYPVSCQQFFAGVVAEVDAEYIANDECHAPVRLTPDEVLAHVGERTAALYRAAVLQVLGIEIPGETPAP